MSRVPSHQSSSCGDLFTSPRLHKVWFHLGDVYDFRDLGNKSILVSRSDEARETVTLSLGHLFAEVAASECFDRECGMKCFRKCAGDVIFIISFVFHHYSFPTASPAS